MTEEGNSRVNGEELPVDVCVVCALAEEAQAFLEVVSKEQQTTFTERLSLQYRYDYRFATLQNNNGETLTLHVSWLPRYGPQEMVLHLSRVLEEYHPCIALMTGICAGDAQRVRLGDLVVAERTFTYDNGKFTLDEHGRSVHLHDTLTYQLDANILQFLGLFDEWKPLVAHLKRPPHPSEQRKPRKIACHIKAMASGSAVRADNPFEDIRAPVRGTVAIDMEGAAFGLVMSRHPLIPWLVVKGVCDYADRDKSDAYHDYAARASALYALSFILAYVTNERLPPPDGSSAPSRAGPSGIWNVPHMRNPHFTGREELLDRLEQQLAPAEQADPMTMRHAALTQPQAIKGLGGIGKTQIAVEYAYRTRHRYAHTLWVNAASEEALLSSFTALGELLPAFAAKSEMDQRKLAAAIKGWLEQVKQRWLLIFDNVNDVSLVHEYLPQQGNGSILITTRANAVGSLGASLEVEKMGLVEGTQFLLHRAQCLPSTNEESSEATNVVIALNGFPLALDQAGAYLEETGCSFADYLQLYQGHRQALLARRGAQATRYPDSVATTWSLSFQKVEQDNPAAAELLQLCAFLSPERIPEELIRDGATHWTSPLQKAAADLFAFNQMLEELLKFSLVKRLADSHMLSIHRLVQAVLLDAMTEQERDQWTQRISKALDAMFPGSKPATWKQCERLLLHVLACLERASPTQKSLELASLASKAAMYLCERARYAEAEPLYQQALHIREQMFGPEHLDVAHSLHNLANLYVKQGKYAEAELYYQRGIHIKETLLEPQHPDVAFSLHCLANLYAEQGKYTQALYQRTLRIYQHTPQRLYSHAVISTLSDLATLYQELGRYAEAETLYKQMLQALELMAEPPDLDMALLLNNMAVLSKVQGKYAEAEQLYQRALHIREQLLDPEHPDIAQSLHNLANLRVELSQYTEAEPLYQQALQIRRKVLETDHPDIAQSLLCLARLYYHQGKYSEAEPLYQQVLQTYEQKLGSLHPATASCLGALANLYMIQGKYSEASPLYQWALQIHTQALGSDHPYVAQTLNNLANLYADCGKCAEAELLYQQALEVREQKVGPLHTDVAESLNNLATLFCQEGKYAEAEPLYQRALHIREQVLGPEHPHTASSLNNLASLYVEQEKYAEAQQLFQRALHIRERALGPNHPDIAHTLCDFAMLWQAQGNHEEAGSFYERALTILIRALGSAHPYTIDARRRLGAVLVAMGKTEEAALLDATQPETAQNGRATNQEEGQ